MRCETGEFPIKIIQGDSYRRVYKFYNADGNLMDNDTILSVVLSVSRLNYTQILNWSADAEGYVFILSAETTSNFPYCKGAYDVTLNFVDHQVSTQVYQSSWQVFEKDVFYNTLTHNKGYMTCEDSEVVIKTGLMITTGGIDDHSQLINRNLPNQHPMGAITGLEEALEDKQPIGDYATTQELDELANIVDSKANASDIPTKTSDLTNDSGFTTKTYVDGIDTNLQGQIDDLQAEKMPLTEIDTTPTEGSTNLVESGGVYDVVDSVQQDVDNIESLISPQATTTNKLVSASEMGDAISSVEAKQLYATASQGSFATKAQLLSAVTYYNADGTVATPTKNDIAYVLTDESHDNKSAKYVIADITSSDIVWGFVITFSDVAFSQAQIDAIDSGITQQRVFAYDAHVANKSNPHEVTYQQLGGTNPSYTKGETDTLLGGKLSDAPKDGKQYARKDGAWSETGAYIVTFTHIGAKEYADKTVAEIYDAWYNKHLPVYAFIGNTILPAVAITEESAIFGSVGNTNTDGVSIPFVTIDVDGEVTIEPTYVQRQLIAGDGITLENDPHSSSVIISSTSSNKSAIIIPYASLGVTPYTFAEVKALLDAGNEVKVQTGSYIPHCTSYSNDIITFFDITSWDLSAGVYNITYVHLRSNNAKYTYSETEPLNPVVYARIAPNYSATSDYAIGDYCTRYENIYRCTTAISGGEEWNSSHWVAVTVMGEIQQSTTELKEDLDALDDRVTELEEHGGGGGTSDHRQLTNRDAANQHPISAITGLQSALDGKQPSGDYALKSDLEDFLTPDDLYESTLIPDFTNQLPIATDENGDIYNGIGYKPYILLNGDGTVSDSSADIVTSGFIPISNNAVIRLDEFELPGESGSPKVVTYDASFEKIQSGAGGSIADHYYFGNAVIDGGNVVQFSISHQPNAAYIRICTKLSMVGSKPIVTVNEEITYSETGKKFLPEVRLDYSQLDNVPDTSKVYTPISPMEHLSIAYSSIGRKPINTIEHFEDCCENYGFNALKADVRPTSDGELICCHDAGFTFDGNGKITTYDANNATMIHDVTAATCVGYAFPTGEHPCVVGDYLDVCRKYGKVAFITIRDQYMDVVIPKLISEIKHRSMQNAVIINSMTYASLFKWREVDDKIAINYTLDRGVDVTPTEIDKAAVLGNCSLNAFGFGGSSTTSDVTCDFDYAASKGIRLLNAICYVSGGYENALAEGYDGAHIGYPWGISNDAKYATKTITDSAGYFTTDTVEGALAEIGAELSGINTLVGSGVIV